MHYARWWIRATVVLVAWVCAAVAQDEAKKPPAITPSARLAAAKTAFVRHGGGSDIPYNVVASGMEGWGRYTLVDSAATADIIVEVSAPGDGGGVSVSSSSTGTGRREQNTTTTRELPSGSTVKLVIYDARNKVPLWSASEPAKSAFRQKQREDNLVQAAQRLVTKFRERVEAPQ